MPNKEVDKVELVNICASKDQHGHRVFGSRMNVTKKIVIGSIILFHTIGTNLWVQPGLADERAYRLPPVEKWLNDLNL